MGDPQARTVVASDTVALSGFQSGNVVTIDGSDGVRGDTPPPPPPDGGYGWVCVACCFTINACTWGAVSSYGVYLSYYLANPSPFPSATPLSYAFVGGLAFGAAMLAAPLITLLARATNSTRTPMASGTVILGGGLVAASYATRTWHLYLSQGVLVGIGVGCLYVPALPVLSQWFGRRRSLANGISGAGSGVGGLVFSFVIGKVAETPGMGIGWSLRIVGLVTVVMNALATAFIRDRNGVVRPAQRPFDRALLRRPEVLSLLAWAFVSMLGYITLLYSLSDYALEAGMGRERATQVTAVLNAGIALGRPFVGVASDRWGRFEVAAGLTLLCGVCCVAVWIPTGGSFGVLVFFALVAGAILGVFWVTIGPLCVEVAGLKQLPSLLALSWLSIVLPTTFSEAISLQLRRPGHPRAYLYPQIFCGVCYVCASVCLWCTRSMVKKR